MNYESATLKPDVSFELPSDVRTLMQIERQIGLVISREIPIIYVCCLFKTLVKCYKFALSLSFQNIYPQLRPHYWLQLYVGGFSKTGKMNRGEQADFCCGSGCIDHLFTLPKMLEHRHPYGSPINVFLDNRAIFNSFDKTVICDCLKKGVSEKFTNILKVLYTNTLGRLRAYSHFFPLFHSSSRVR